MWALQACEVLYSNPIFLLATVFPLVLGVAYTHRRRVRRRAMPPGPPGLPIIGNLLQLTRDAWIPFTKWGKQYGPIVYINVLGTDIIVLSSLKVATDLLDRQASKYSSRPPNIVAAEMLCGGYFFGFLPDNDRWKRMRRGCHELLTKSASAKYSSYRFREARILVESLLKDTKDWPDLPLKCTASLLLTLAYDEPPLQSLQDPAFTRINAFINRMVYAGSPGNYLVEFFTWMKYLPSSIATWKREALEWFRRDDAMFEELYRNAVQKALSDEGSKLNFSSIVSREKDQLGLSDGEARWILASLYSAGSETSAAGLEWFFMAMALHPEVQRKAQEELDAVVGTERMPNASDIEELPYIRAIAKEVLRWRSPTPMGLPHVCTEDNWYEGYFIPKGAICMPNIWGISHDPDVYGEDVEDFKPERFLDGDLLARLNTDTKGEGHATFGFGKRICSGRHVANDTLHATIATILWALTLEVGPDPSGKPAKISTEGSGGIAMHPCKFDLKVKTRFPEVKAILERSKES